MKHLCILVAMFFAATTILSAAEATKASNGDTPSTVAEKASYALGFHYGTRLRVRGIDKLDYSWFKRGAKGAIEGKRPSLPPTGFTKAMNEFIKDCGRARAELAKRNAQRNLDRSLKYLADNKAKNGVVVMASGLQYRVLRVGAGPSPNTTQMVEVNYEGRLVNGKIFDSSYKRNRAATFRLKGLIKGWKEGLKKMKVGAKYEFFIPPELAYGNRRKGNRIPPNSALIFVVELLGVKDAPKPIKRKFHMGKGGAPHGKMPLKRGARGLRNPHGSMGMGQRKPRGSMGMGQRKPRGSMGMGRRSPHGSMGMGFHGKPATKGK